MQLSKSIVRSIELLHLSILQLNKLNQYCLLKHSQHQLLRHLLFLILQFFKTLLSKLLLPLKVLPTLQSSTWRISSTIISTTPLIQPPLVAHLTLTAFAMQTVQAPRCFLSAVHRLSWHMPLVYQRMYSTSVWLNLLLTVPQLCRLQTLMLTWGALAQKQLIWLFMLQ